MEQERTEREDIEQQTAEWEQTAERTGEGAEETAQESEQEDTHGRLCFEIVECGDYTDKKLQREFGRFVLSRRPL